MSVQYVTGREVAEHSVESLRQITALSEVQVRPVEFALEGIERNGQLLGCSGVAIG